MRKYRVGNEISWFGTACLVLETSRFLLVAKCGFFYELAALN